ncbi:MAG: ABC transporter permease subunit [Acidobacteria bacterium]|nr:ABC transporter permease subunit [Acidobacteriota bacterium]MDW7984528.1 ABC transporter permease subunit [Acidobacteriota bacterium]
MREALRHAWDSTRVLMRRPCRLDGASLLIMVSLVGLLLGLIEFARESFVIPRAGVVIDLSPWALPKYTFFSLVRGLLAYGLSLGFTLVVGYWAAKDPRAERVLIPALDVLQSIPILGFMPGLVLGLTALFPSSRVGLELAAILLIFTSQVWNLTFSWYHSLRSVPRDLVEVADLYRLSGWQRLRWLELPFAAMGLVWNSMMSMAGGWFFLMASEAFVLGGRDFRLPGLGAYMSEAVAWGDVRAMGLAVLAMVVMIVALDQFLWRPVVVWAQKFRVEETGAAVEVRSWFLEWLRRRAPGRRWRRWVRQWVRRGSGSIRWPSIWVHRHGRWARRLTTGLWVGLGAGLVYGAWGLVGLLRQVPRATWEALLPSVGWTLGRVVLATAAGTAWALPAGLWIGLSPRRVRTLQPVVQVVASFPAPMLFPAVLWGLTELAIPLAWGSVVLQLLGTQWYILFNVIAGAMSVPTDLRETVDVYRVRGLRRFWVLYGPSVFPYLVTGWVAAAGGAWNASIIAEYVIFRGQRLTTPGLGAWISEAAERGDFPALTAGIVTMAAVVVALNRLVWRRLYQVAERHFSLQR